MYLTPYNVFAIREALFGRVEKPGEDADEQEKFAFRRKLVSAMSLIFACVGTGYQIACVDSEKDVASDEGGRWELEWTLEGLGGYWVARGVRNACGFQLSRDAQEAEKLRGIREEEARGFDEEEDDPEEEYETLYGPSRLW